MSGKDLRDYLGFLAVVAGLVFVGLEVRQNTIAARAAAYQEIGLAATDGWLTIAHDPGMAELRVLSSDTSRLDEIDEIGWEQLAAHVTGVMRAWETVYLQVQQGLLPEDAMNRLGFGVDPRTYYPNTFDLLWPVVRERMNPEFATYIESQVGVTP